MALLAACSAANTVRSVEPSSEPRYSETQGAKEYDGTLHVSEPGVSNRAQVIVDTGNLFGTPTYRVTDIFTW